MGDKSNFLTPLYKIKGIKKSDREVLRKLNIYRVSDLLYRLPCNYRLIKQKFFPVYESLPDISDTVKHLFNSNLFFPQNLPQSLVNKYNLPSLKEALYNVHFPNRLNEISFWMNRIRYEELYHFNIVQGEIIREMSLPKGKLKVNNDNKFFREKNKKQNRLNVLVSNPTNAYLRGIISTYIENNLAVIYVSSLDSQDFITQLDFNYSHLRTDTASSDERTLVRDLKLGNIKLLFTDKTFLSHRYNVPNIGLIIIDTIYDFSIDERYTLITKSLTSDIVTVTNTLPSEPELKTIFRDMEYLGSTSNLERPYFKFCNIPNDEKLFNTAKSDVKEILGFSSRN